MSNFSEMKEFIDYTFYKMESDVKGFDENLQKFKEELFTYCEQLGFKTEKYVGVHHLVEFTVKDENNRDYDVTLFSFDYKIKNKMSYLYLDDTVRGILKHRKDDMFIYLERNDDTLYNCSLDDKLIEYKQLATDWAKILKERKIEKKKAELEQDFVNDDVSEDESVADVQVEKDSSDKPLPIYKRFAKNLLNVFKKDSK
jgi:hypothetical protein